MTTKEVSTLELVVHLDCKIPKIELRDLFAMAALNGLLSVPSEVCSSLSECTEFAYRYADAMLEARGE